MPDVRHYNRNEYIDIGLSRKAPAEPKAKEVAAVEPRGVESVPAKTETPAPPPTVAESAETSEPETAPISAEPVANLASGENATAPATASTPSSSPFRPDYSASRRSSFIGRRIFVILLIIIIIAVLLASE